MSHDPRRPHRQDTFDLRDQILTDASNAHQHHHHNMQHEDDHDHSIMEDDSEGEEGEEGDEFMDEDDSSSLSIPNEAIDFDLVYSLHTFVATVEGQANVVKGDSLFLMDDSNSYWWLVRVLKTQEVGYIPAENIETPFERLARLNKHRNVDLASASPDERTADPVAYRAAERERLARQHHPSHPAHPSNIRRRSVSFRHAYMFHYPPAIWNEDDQEGTEDEDYEGYETGLEHTLNDEEDWDEEGDEEWENIANSGVPPPGGMLEKTFADQQPIPLQQDTPPLSLQQPRSQQPGQQPRNGPPQQVAPQGQYTNDPRDRNGSQTSLQYNQQDPRSMQTADPNSALHQQTSNSSLRQQGSNPSLRQQGSREGLGPDVRSLNSSGSTSPAGSINAAPASGPKVFDPEALDSNETRKISATPSVARDQQYARNDRSQGYSNGSTGGQGPTHPGPKLPSAILADQENERKRVREVLEEEDRKRRNREGSERSSSQQSNRPDAGKPGGKLVKSPGKEPSSKEREKAEKERERAEREAEEKEGGKKRGVFSSIFRKKDKSSDRGVSASSRKTEDDYYSRGDSISASEEGGAAGMRGYSNDRPSGQQGPSNFEAGPQGHGSRVQQIDMKQQAAYRGYMDSAAVRETTHQPSYGTLPASVALPNNNANPNAKPSAMASCMKPGTSGQPGVTQFGERTKAGVNTAGGLGVGSISMNGGVFASGHQRPGSLILTAGGLGYEGAIVPELSVMRVFAGSHLATEATFKTVLINTSTTSGDLVKQAMQRFRVAAGEDANDYYLTVKTAVDGSSRALQPQEKPLLVFQDWAGTGATDDAPPTVKRSSIASISSLSSNLSMHPAIKRLPMDDFTDDSTVKFYLNRRASDDEEMRDRDWAGSEELPGPEGGKHESLMSMGSTTDEDPFGDGVSAPNSTNSNLAVSVSAEQVASPTARFSLQLLIYPDDLPDGMVFDPHTEAIIPKSTLKERTPLGATASPGIPQTFRRKVFAFPKNTTVAEVIELGLERFGISEGVVDGGDEVEDKSLKRRSGTRVRYSLSCLKDGQEKELLPSSKVVEAFGRPPSFRMVENRRSGDGRRRSADATLLLGSIEDVQAEDPVFILRRAVAYRTYNTPRSRLSAPLDELALQHSRNQRESITASEASTNRDDEPGSASVTPRPGATGSRAPPAQLSRQEIIAAQRAASRANQRAILSAQSNSEQGVDILLPDKATIRSSKMGGSGDVFRYSYIEPDGETYDISEIMEEEWSPNRDKGDSHHHTGGLADGQVQQIGGTRNDLLEGALGRHGVSETGQQTLGEKIDRVLNKLKTNPNIVGSSGTKRVSSIYTDKDVVLSPPSRPARALERAPSRSNTPNTSEPLAKGLQPRGTTSGPQGQLRHQSAQSNEDSDMSVYESMAGTPNRADMNTASATNKTRAFNDRHNDSPNRSVLDEGTEEDHYLPPPSTRKRPLLVLKDHDFGLSRMMAVIEMNAAMQGPAPWQVQAGINRVEAARGLRRLKRQQSLLSSDDVVDNVLFGPKVNVDELHPRIREVYEPTVKRLEVLDKQIDDLLGGILGLSKGQ